MVRELLIYTKGVGGLLFSGWRLAIQRHLRMNINCFELEILGVIRIVLLIYMHCMLTNFVVYMCCE